MGMADSSHRVRVGDIELAYRIAGRGKPVILIHVRRRVYGLNRESYALRSGTSRQRPNSTIAVRIPADKGNKD